MMEMYLETKRTSSHKRAHATLTSELFITAQQPVSIDLQRFEDCVDIIVDGVDQQVVNYLPELRYYLNEQGESDETTTVSSEVYINVFDLELMLVWTLEVPNKKLDEQELQTWLTCNAAAGFGGTATKELAKLFGYSVAESFERQTHEPTGTDHPPGTYL